MYFNRLSGGGLPALAFGNKYMHEWRYSINVYTVYYSIYIHNDKVLSSSHVRRKCWVPMKLCWEAFQIEKLLCPTSLRQGLVIHSWLWTTTMHLRGCNNKPQPTVFLFIGLTVSWVSTHSSVSVCTRAYNAESVYVSRVDLSETGRLDFVCLSRDPEWTRGPSLFC